MKSEIYPFKRQNEKRDFPLNSLIIKHNLDEGKSAVIEYDAERILKELKSSFFPELKDLHDKLAEKHEHSNGTVLNQFLKVVTENIVEFKESEN